MTVAMNHWSLGAAAGILLLGLNVDAQAQTFPDKPIKIIVPAAAGGPTDVPARLASQILPPRLNQPIVIENRPGAGGAIGAKAVATAAPDGYTLMAGNTSVFAVIPAVSASAGYDPIKDFAPVAKVSESFQILVVRPSFPANTLKEFIDYAKANPGKVTYSSPGIGTTPHLSGELFKRMAGIELIHVPYRGAGAGAITDTIAGRVDSAFNTTGSLLQTVRSGQLRGLAVTTLKRFPTAPELPTIAESGIPGFDVSSWYALFVPAKTPPEIIARLNAATVTALSEPAVRARFEPLGVVVESSTPEGLGALLQSEIDKWGPIIKAAGISASN